MAQGNDQGKQQNQKPNRKDFQRIVVIASNASVVDERDWQKTLGDKQGKDRKSLLKENGWTETRVFDSQAYDDARKNFRDQSRAGTKAQRQDLFQRIFQEADVAPRPRLESMLRTVLPIVDTSNEQRMMKALTGVLTSVEKVLKPEEPKPQGRGRGGRGRNSNKDDDGAKNDNKKEETVH